MMRSIFNTRRTFFLSAAWLLASFVVTTAPAGMVETFDDISFWVGEGENQAALVLDWDGHSAGDRALVWGYRWDDAATSADMFNAILHADSRLFAKVGEFGGGVAVFGVGYDGNASRAVELDDGTPWNAAGIFNTTPADGAVATQPFDVYREGWFLGYWHHAVGSPESWVSGAGLSSRQLSDGDWDSLAYKDTVDPILAPPSLLAAAESIGALGDFDRNGTVDASDFTVWRDSVGSTPLFPGYGADGSFDGIINSDDYDAWVSGFTNQLAGSGQFVPEPAVGNFAWMVLIVIFTMRKYV